MLETKSSVFKIKTLWLNEIKIIIITINKTIIVIYWYYE